MDFKRIVLGSRMRAASRGATAVVILVLIMSVGAAYLYVSPKAITSASTIPVQPNTFTNHDSGATTSTTTTATTTLYTNGVQVVVADGSGENDDGGTRFDPAVINVVIGVNNTVTWINQDEIVHNVLSVSGYFYSGDLSRGQSYTFTFTRAGTYPFFCSYYPIMSGVVTVENP